MMTTICTCVMSLVERVINEAVENSLNSARENRITFSKTSWRRFRPRPAATRADRYPTPMLQEIESSVNSSIKPPVRRM